MDIRQLYYFLNVAECGGISLAAEKLHISQPPLTRQIRRLEEELGLALFCRRREGVRLTAAGEELRRLGLELMADYISLLRDLEALRQEEPPSIVFGANDGAHALVAPAYAHLFTSLFPDGRVETRAGSGEELLAGLMAERLDIVFIRLPIPEPERFDILRQPAEQWLAVAAEDYPVPVDWGKTLSVAQLAGEQLILPSRQTLHQPLLARLGGGAQVVCYYFELTSSLVLARNGLGVALAPDCVLRLGSLAHCRVWPVSDMQVDTCYAAIRKRGTCRSQAARRFWQQLQHTPSLAYCPPGGEDTP